MDIRNAHRVIPIHPGDPGFMGMYWQDSLFVVTALPFGPHFTPRSLLPLADAAQSGINFVIHY